MKRLLTILLLFSCGLISAQSYHIGDLYTAPDGSKGIVFYLHPDGSGGWVVALKDSCMYCAWGDTIDIPDLINSNVDFIPQLLSDTAGYAHTQAMRAAQSYHSYYAAWNVDFENGWYLPAPAQLSILFGMKPIIDPKIIAAGGTALGPHVGNNAYWSSSEHSKAEAWVVDYSIYYPGDFETKKKNYLTYGVRAVRSFTYTVVVHDSSLTYLWNTGSTDPSIEVSPAHTTSYTVTATSEHGCSNTAQQTILVSNGGMQTLYDTVCQGAGYEANGFTLTEAETDTVGTFTRVRILETESCPDTVTLQLTVKPFVTELVEITACENYIWNGVTYYESGSLSQYYTASNGCDSIVTLVLSISEPPQVNVTTSADTVCPGGNVTLQAVTENVSVALPIAVGDILCTDGSTVKPAHFAASGKTAMGVVFYVDSTQAHGWAVHLHDQGSKVKWSSTYSDVPGVSNVDNTGLPDFAGYTNTVSLWAAGDSAAYPAAHTVDLAHDWYLPDIGQLSLLFSNIIAINASLSLADGTPFPMDMPWYYWSSSEVTTDNYPYAWVLKSDGNVDYSNKMYNNVGGINYRVRSIRDF